MKINDNTKVIIKVLSFMITFYLFIFTIWNFSNENHKPSSMFYDWRKEGYSENPLHDRKSPNFLDKGIRK